MKNLSLEDSQKTKDSDWTLLCDDCKTSGRFDKMKEHYGHKHRVVRNE